MGPRSETGYGRLGGRYVEVTWIGRMKRPILGTAHLDGVHMTVDVHS
ncbi:hypothetical protein B005_0058 [Nocardiopsis alba ATCC BAA-2165]|uniref:Uncharacterized protein n=1 Tax=Nocardiopsis alba (strain ATCC BAA-2165 / BE74) TaxID=1205910 RepID=J7L9N4_NOCAA|nr:hypothetical protein B005_0058 [Nocardiopsis alba ATCC BAA-2165]